MNRKIKFRIWDKVKKIYLLNHNFNSIVKCHLVNEDDFERYIYQQFTGLKDKNGQEIYEADIIKDLDEENLIIEFHNGSFIANGKTIIPFWSMLVKNELVQPATVNSQTFEVVGNVFENPELLK